MSHQNLLSDAIADCRRNLWGVVVTSGLVNLLLFAAPLYMLQVYDRVLASRSIPTLIALTVLLVVLFLFQWVLDSLRGRLVVRVARLFDEHLAGPVHRLAVQLGAAGRSAAETGQPLRDLDSIRGFVSGPGPAALMDLPWLPLFVGACFLVHPAIGVMAIVGAALLAALTLLTERAGRPLQADSSRHGAARQVLLDATQRHADTVRSMGMEGPLRDRWLAVNGLYLDAAQRLSDVVGGFGTASKVFRMLLQSLVLGCGALLVIGEQMSGGAMVACSILVGRALAPVEAATANWRGCLAGWQGVQRLRRLFERLPAPEPRTPLPAPTHSVAVQDLAVFAPGAPSLPVLRGVTFAAEAGTVVGIVGPSAAGKSTLGRCLAGAWAPGRGTVRLDGGELAHRDPETLGRHVGYLPQQADLFEGTIAENIARMAVSFEADAVVRAAMAAGAHDMIQAMPDGYDTRVGEGGATLSGGQRQRIGLARALFGEPFLVVLDEPNANLDNVGELALLGAIRGLKRRGAVTFLIAHRSSILVVCDTLLLLSNGTQQAYGPRDEVLRSINPQPVLVPGTRHEQAR